MLVGPSLKPALLAPPEPNAAEKVEGEKSESKDSSSKVVAPVEKKSKLVDDSISLATAFSAAPVNKDPLRTPIQEKVASCCEAKSKVRQPRQLH